MFKSIFRRFNLLMLSIPCSGGLIFAVIIALIVLSSANRIDSRDMSNRPHETSIADNMNTYNGVSSQNSLTIEERIACQQIIEKIYWKYRIWPKDNSTKKPSFDAIMSRESMKAKVEDVLRISNAINYLWKSPVTGEQLQAEMQRIALHTKQPELLKEIWKGLHNNPYLIAECFVRPIITDKLARNLFAGDETIHSDMKRIAQSELQNYAAFYQSAPAHGFYSEIEYIKSNGKDLLAEQELLNDRRRMVNNGEWQHLIATLVQIMNNEDSRARINESEINLIPLNQVSALMEDNYRFYAIKLLERNPDKIKIATFIWNKLSFEAWWESQRAQYSFDIAPAGYNYILPDIFNPGVPCLDDIWATITDVNAPPPRWRHTAVWTGVEMIVWGGYNGAYLDTGGKYYPSTDSWADTTTVNAPTGRIWHTAVWTGTEMIIWGGDDIGGSFLNTGGKYNPVSNSWSATSTTNAPSDRTGHASVWTGTEMVVWGGVDGVSDLNTGGRYIPSTDAWTATSTVNAPDARAYHTAVWTGSEMIIWAGVHQQGRINTGGRYHPGANSWTSVSTSNAPEARDIHKAVWTGTEMIVWGGFTGTTILDTGGKYNPDIDTWISTSLANVPRYRSYHTAIWTGTEMIVWGGFDGENIMKSGGRYNAVSNSWSNTSITNPPQERAYHTAIWTGTQMIVWGGSPGTGFLNTGGKYCGLVCKTATYDSTYKAPLCPITNCCESGTLLISRDTINGLGESNQPDTIFDSCADGTTGTYHQEESIDNVTIRSIDGSIIRPGVALIATSDVWCFDDTNFLSFYYTPTISPLAWSFLAEGQCTDPSPSVQTFVDTFNVPGNDSIQALRSNLRRGGSLSLCTSGSTDDHDDLLLTICQILHSPINVSPVKGSITCASPALTWNAVANAIGYDVWVDGTKICSDITTTNCPTTLTSGSHDWYVVAKNFCNETSTGQTWNFTIGSGPTGLSNNTAADLHFCEDTGVRISWNSDPADWADIGGSGTRTYEILRDAVSIATLSYGTTTFVDTTGTNNMTYTYTVRYINGCNLNSTTSPGANAADTIGEMPLYLTNNTAMNMSNCWDPAVLITWNQDAGDWHDNAYNWAGRTYEVLRDGISLITLPYGVTNYIDASGTANQFYTYTVRYINGCNVSATTSPGENEAGMIGGNPIYLNNNSATDMDQCLATGVLITWDQDPGDWRDNADNWTGREYEVLRDGVSLITLPYGTTNYIDTTGTANQIYTYTVRYINGCGFSSATSPGIDTADVIDTTPPSNVGDTMMISESIPNIELNWAVATDAVMYNVYRSNTPSAPFPGGWTLLAQPASNSYADPAYVDTNNYFYQIIAVDICGNTSSY